MLRIGTRGSALARWQARFVHEALEPLGEAEVVVVETSGDRDRSTALTSLQTPGFFTKELEQALIDGRVDLAVHSLKDLPTKGPAELDLVAVGERGDPRDTLLVRPGAHDPSRGALPILEGGRLGTGSNRRRAQVRARRPDLEILDLRGNVPTRVEKLVEGQYDAILVAQAALRRLEIDVGDLAAVPLAVEVMVPAPGQAAVGVQMRRGDSRTAAVVEAVHHEATGLAVLAERRLMSLLEGGCQLPLGVHVTASEEGARLHAALAPPPEPGDLPEPSSPTLTVAGPDVGALVSRAFENLRPHARRHP